MKKLFALLLCFAMVLGLLAGCGGAASETAPASSAPEEASAPAAPAEVEEEAEEVDIEEDGGSVEEASEVEAVPEAEFDIYGPFSDETITLTYWKLWPPFLEGFDPMDASLFSTLYEALNVKVDVTTIGTDSADTKFNLMVASGDYLDIIENAGSNYSGGGFKAIQDEVLVDMMPYMATYAPDYWAMLQTDPVAMKTMVSDNQMAEMVSLYDEEPCPMSGQSGLWIRQDWLGEQELDTPSTLEDIENVLKVFKTEYGCSDAFAARETCDMPFHHVFGAYEWALDGDTVVYGYTDTKDAMKEYLKTAHKWFEEGYFSSGFITANDTTMPKSSMVVDQSTGLFDADILIVSEVSVLDPDIEISALAPITKNADDKIPYGWTSRMNSSNKASVSTNCEIPEVAIAYINYAFTDEAYMAVNWGTEGETYTMENGEPVFTDLMLNNPNLPASFTPLAYISPGFPFQKSYQMALASYNHPAQKACYDIFASKTDKSLPKIDFPKDYLSFTTEESETIAQYQSDIDTYVTESLAKFITGDLDVEKDYDAFASQLEAMNVGEIKDIYQSAYDRFMA